MCADPSWFPHSSHCGLHSYCAASPPRDTRLEAQGGGYKGQSSSIPGSNHNDMSGESDSESAMTLLESSPHRPSQTGFLRRHAPSPMFLLCIFLHAVPLGVHVALVALQDRTVSCQETQLAYIMVTCLPVAIFGVSTCMCIQMMLSILKLCAQLYAILLRYVTGKLAFARYFYKKVTLSALHDNTSAWQSSGAAAIALWRQWKLPTAPLEGIAILIYLGCISGLGTTTPGLLNISLHVVDPESLIMVTSYLNEVQQQQ